MIDIDELARRENIGTWDICVTRAERDEIVRRLRTAEACAEHFRRHIHGAWPNEAEDA